MSRITGADPARQETPIRKVLEGQAEIWGTPLESHLVYARRPSLFRAVNRRVAGLNAAVGSELRISDEELAAVERWEAWKRR